MTQLQAERSPLRASPATTGPIAEEVPWNSACAVEIGFDRPERYNPGETPVPQQKTRLAEYV